jgi:hypothetical protein
VKTILAQEKKEKNKIYYTWVKSITNASTPKVFLHSLEDSVVFTTSNLDMLNADLISHSVSEIRVIKTKRKGRLLRGALVGACAGLIFGGLTGLASGDDEPSGFYQSLYSQTKEQKAVTGMIGGFFAGGALGTIIGVIKIRIPIHGDQSTYNSKKPKLQKYLYKDR